MVDLVMKTMFKWFFVTRGRYERDLEQAGNLAKTLAGMVDREYSRATDDVRRQVHTWAANANYKSFHGGRVDFTGLERQFAPSPTTLSGLIEQAGIPSIGGGPSPWVHQLMGEIADDNKAIEK